MFRKYDVAEPHHLYAALDQAAAEDGAISAYNGITMHEYFSTWANQGGHPLLTVIIDQSTGQMTVTQVSFMIIQLTVNSYKTKYTRTFLV